MLEIHELRQLIAVAENGTLSAAAKSLQITQPVMSRSMQNIEKKLNQPLFQRSGRNRIALNEAGLFAANEAKKVIAALEAMDEKMVAFAERRNTITVASSAPAPLWEICRTLQAHFRDQTVKQVLAEEKALFDGLLSGLYTITIMERPVVEEGFFSAWYSTEQLHISLPLGHRLSGRDTISMAELDGETMLLFHELGSWSALCERELRHARFIVQEDRRIFSELTRESTIPCFATNMTGSWSTAKNPRVEIPISDPEALKNYYMCVKTQNVKLLDALQT